MRNVCVLMLAVSLAVAADRAVINTVPDTWSPANERDPTDFSNWVRMGSPANVDAPVISSDGAEITFTRTTPGDGADAVDYVQWQFGPIRAGSNLSVSMEVTAFDAAGSTPVATARW